MWSFWFFFRSTLFCSGFSCRCNMDFFSTAICFWQVYKHECWKGLHFLQVSCDSPAVHGNWPVLPKLLFSFMHLPNKIYESLPWLWHSLLWPISKLELANRAWLAILKGKKGVNLSKSQKIKVVQKSASADSPWHQSLWTLAGCTEACYTLPWDPPRSTGIWPSAPQASTGDTSPAEDSTLRLRALFFHSEQTE